MKATFRWLGLVVVALGGGLDGCSGSLSNPDGGGSGGTNGGNFGQPACPSTVAKGGACAAADVQFCYRPCGPENIGVKSETCASGAYAEMTGCVFDPGRDYSCYKLPAAPNAACPVDATPQANAPCSVAACLVCNSAGGAVGGGYLDSTGAMKVGTCVCSASTSKWSCASDTAWPCPMGSGC